MDLHLLLLVKTFIVQKLLNRILIKKENHITINGKTYEGLDYYENSEPIIVNYDKDGNPVYSKPIITETIEIEIKLILTEIALEVTETLI